jgi:hypothetical protein
MQLPLIHANGSDPVALRDGYLVALNAADLLLEVLRACAPHGHDYYPVSPGAIVTATAEHRARISAIERVQADLRTLALHVMESSG